MGQHPAWSAPAKTAAKILDLRKVGQECAITQKQQLSRWTILITPAMETNMRTFAVGALICLALSSVDISHAEAAPWCANYSSEGANCGFQTYQQCQATVRGGGGFCWPNPAAS